MSAYSATFTVNSNGELTIPNLPFTPTLVTLTASSENGVSENDQGRFSTGSASATSQAADAMLVNTHYPEGVTRDYRNDNGRCLVALGTPGGTLTRVLDISFVEFDTNAVTFNVLAKHANYTFSVRAEFFA